MPKRKVNQKGKAKIRKVLGKLLCFGTIVKQRELHCRECELKEKCFMENMKAEVAEGRKIIAEMYKRMFEKYASHAGVYPARQSDSLKSQEE